jgi:hypothetical protein
MTNGLPPIVLNIPSGAAPARVTAPGASANVALPGKHTAQP